MGHDARRILKCMQRAFQRAKRRAVQIAGRVIASPKSGICLYQLTRWVEVQDFGATFRKQNEVSIVQLPRSWIEYCAVYGKNRCAQKKVDAKKSQASYMFPLRNAPFLLAPS